MGLKIGMRLPTLTGGSKADAVMKDGFEGFVFSPGNIGLLIEDQSGGVLRN